MTAHLKPLLFVCKMSVMDKPYLCLMTESGRFLRIVGNQYWAMSYLVENHYDRDTIGTKTGLRIKFFDPYE